MPVLMFINIKGGVAKTTSAVAVSQFLAEAGKRILLIDADHQCAAGELLLGERRLERCDSKDLTLHDLMSEIVKDEFRVETLADYVVPASSGDEAAEGAIVSVIPCSLRIEEYHKKYIGARHDFHSNEEFRMTVNRRLRRVRKWLRAHFDYTIIDCPPSLPIHVQMLVKVADAYVLPTIPDKLSVRGSCYFVDRLRRTRFKIPGLGTLWSLYRDQIAIHREMISLASDRKDLFSWMPEAFDTVIPNAAAIARAMEYVDSNESLNARYSPSFAAKYRKLVGEIEERCGKLPSAQRQREAMCTAS